MYFFNLKRPKRLYLYLIKPSKYDDDGYVIRHWKGVLPSNTLACLYGLSEDLREKGTLGKDLDWQISLLDETVQKVNVEEIIRKSKRKNSKTVVCLAGVQSNQFVRASDLAKSLKRSNIDVLIGGFHVSGVVATLKGIPKELQELQALGVSLVAGEVEEKWEMILTDALSGNLKPLYNFLLSPPDLLKAPLPRIPKSLLRKYAVSHFATLDCGRGCPFECSFCTVINVQGRKMRYRSVDAILQMIHENYVKHSIWFYFFTDDNFSRNKNWEPIFDGLIEMRKKFPRIHFMMQVDTQSYRIPGFVDKAALAGCSQVFIGLESINQKNLQAAGKKQNRIDEFKQLVQAYQERSIAAHLAYIIGFPFDTEESVQQDIKKIQIELGAQQASFFMLTPLPGSVDYRNIVSKGQPVDADLNNFDSFHQTYAHDGMKRGAWEQAYQSAWKSFYRVENLIRILKSTPPQKTLDIFQNFIWYKNAIQVEGGHPMIQGFIRLKGRRNRRPIYPMEGRLQYAKRRFFDFCQTFKGWFLLAMEMEEVWLATRRRGVLEERVLHELALYKSRAAYWRQIRLSELHELYERAAHALEKKTAGLSIRVPSHFQLWIQKWNWLDAALLPQSRRSMTAFWKRVTIKIRRGYFHHLSPSRIFIMGGTEIALLCRFLFSLFRGNIG